MQTAPPVEDDVMQRIGELRSSMSKAPGVLLEPADLEEYVNPLAANGDLVIASFVVQRLPELKAYVSQLRKRDELAAYLWLQRVQEDRYKTKERFLTMDRLPNEVSLDGWRTDLEREKKAAKDRARLETQK